MKLTEHSCCFDNEDDGNFFGETRDSVTGFILGLSKGLFQWTRRETAHLPSARLEPAERRTSKSSPQMWCLSIFLSE